MDATQELIAIVGRQPREIAERGELLGHAAMVIERNTEALERAAVQREPLRRLVA